MGLKKNVLLSDQSVSFIAARRSSSDVDGDAISWSAGINQAVGDLSWLLRELVPDLDVRTWRTLLDAYAGHFFDGPSITPYRLASDVMDHHGAISLEELDPLTAAAVRELHRLNQPQQYAAAQVARLFWAQPSRWTGDLDDQITQIREQL